jgi:glycosyltransferase involved in cell wall biosynthesis
MELPSAQEGHAVSHTIPVTVVLPVKNEARNLLACLERLSRFAHVLVVDSQSTDPTIEIARQHGAEVVQFEWDGRYPKKRNWVLLNYRFNTEWVLFLDADEILDEAFCNELASTLRGTDKVGFWLHFSNYFLGQPLRHGVGQRKLALMKVGSGLYEKIEEDGWSNLDMEVHEHPVLDGPLGELKAKIDHRDLRGLESFLKRHVEYAKWEVARYSALTQTHREGASHLTDRQRFKYRHLSKWWFPWLYFATTYVAKLGFLDGRVGLTHAYYKAWYFETIRQLLIEKRRTM